MARADQIILKIYPFEASKGMSAEICQSQLLPLPFPLFFLTETLLAGTSRDHLKMVIANPVTSFFNHFYRALLNLSTRKRNNRTK